MNPLFFAHWGQINAAFCAVLWLVALVLLMAIAASLLPAETGHTARHMAVR